MNIEDITYLKSNGDPRIVLDRLQKSDQTLAYTLSSTIRYEFLDALNGRQDDAKKYYEWLLQVQITNNIVGIARCRWEIKFRNQLGELKFDIYIGPSESAGDY